MGNFLIVIIFVRDVCFRKLSLYFIMSLVIVDLFIGLFILLMWIYELGLGVLWYLKMVYYGFLVFFVIDIFINLVLILNLIVIFLERLYVILFLW